MIPRAFRIRRYKSIVDSGRCPLSGDGITVLAGQNEAGKSSVLTALRDFDLPAGTPPLTADYTPDGLEDAGPPEVAVEFEVDAQTVEAFFEREEWSIPVAVIDHLRTNPRLWITRDLTTHQYAPDLPEAVLALFPKPAADEPSAAPTRPGQKLASSDPVSARPRTAPTATPVDGVADAQNVDGAPPVEGPPMTPGGLVRTAAQFADDLRYEWPAFVLFDSFNGLLPREVSVDAVVAEVARQAEYGAPETDESRALRPVMDFLSLAGVDIARVAALGAQDKAFGNYLRGRSGAITGDFLSYWKQKTGDSATVRLRVQHRRDEAGVLKLTFYVSDEENNQYPEQRSQGFRWFLSFYLRLAAAKRNAVEKARLLLIDEPGSYLHARAQRDVLALFEERIATEGDAVVYSTHSPYLIPADARLHRLRIVAKQLDGGTRVYDRLTHPDLRGDGALDTLTPVIAAVGLDVRHELRLAADENVLVEGITDRLYLLAWARRWRPAFAARFNVLPGTGGNTLAILASMFTGWGFPFVVLLDADRAGQTERKRLARDLLLPPTRVLDPTASDAAGAVTIEDVFAPDDFAALLAAVDGTLTVTPGELPSAACKRLKLDKVLVARRFAEGGSELAVSAQTEHAACALLDAIAAAAAPVPDAAV